MSSVAYKCSRTFQDIPIRHQTIYPHSTKSPVQDTPPPPQSNVDTTYMYPLHVHDQYPVSRGYPAGTSSVGLYQDSPIVYMTNTLCPEDTWQLGRPGTVPGLSYSIHDQYPVSGGYPTGTSWDCTRTLL